MSPAIEGAFLQAILDDLPDVILRLTFADSLEEQIEDGRLAQPSV